MKKITYLTLFILMTSFLINTLMYYPHNRFFASYEDLDFWITKFSPSSQKKKIFLGDSRVYRGIYTDMFNALNFGFSSNTYTLDYLNESLERCLGSCDVFLGISPQSLTEFQKDDKFKEYKKLAQSKLQYVSRVMSLYIRNLKLTSSLTKQIKKELDFEKIDGFKYNNWGFIESSPLKKDDSMGVEFYKIGFKNYKFSHMIFEQLNNFIRKYKNKHTFYFFFPPSSKEVVMYERNVQNTGFDFNHIVNRLKQSGAIYLETDKYSYMGTYDGDHLAKKDATIFTKELLLKYTKNLTQSNAF